MPWPSSTCATKVSVSVSPWRSQSRSAAAGLYVQLIVCCSPSEVSASNVTAVLAISAVTSIEFASTGSVVLPLYAAVALPFTVTVSVSPTSWSVILIVPVTAAMSCVELSPATSAMAAGFVAASIVGTSFVPVIVITRSCAPTLPWPSSTCAT